MLGTVSSAARIPFPSATKLNATRFRSSLIADASLVSFELLSPDCAGVLVECARCTVCLEAVIMGTE
jgi:hypothetical protein